MILTGRARPVRLPEGRLSRAICAHRPVIRNDRIVEMHHDDRSEVAALAARVGLRGDLLDAPVAQLSTGERQRFSLVRALLRSPPVLLLDEPTGPLDEESVVRVEALLREQMAAGTSIVLVTHDSNQAERLASRRYRMAAGHLETP
ncbi:MAG: hypothetical protein NVSMB20_18690 [Bradyrhizobium sp.]